MAAELVRDAESVLDHGTGGGEVLADVLAAAGGSSPALTVATEGYPPNVLVARRRLAPLEVSVVHVHGGTGFQVDDYREQLLSMRYLDIAAVVFALRMVPWAVGPFSLEDHEPRFRELYERGEPVVTGSTAVFLRATRPRS